MKPSLIFPLLSFALSALPGALALDSWVPDSCQAALNAFTFCDEDLTYYQCRCKNNIFTSSVIQCILSLTDDQRIVPGIAFQFASDCREYGMVQVTYEEIIASYQADVASNNFTNTANISNRTEELTTPVILSPEDLEIAIKTVKTFNWEVYSGSLFG